MGQGPEDQVGPDPNTIGADPHQQLRGNREDSTMAIIRIPESFSLALRKALHNHRTMLINKDQYERSIVRFEMSHQRLAYHDSQQFKRMTSPGSGSDKRKQLGDKGTRTGKKLIREEVEI